MVFTVADEYKFKDFYEIFGNYRKENKTFSPAHMINYVKFII